MLIFFCKQKTEYEMRISDWSSDVCSSDLIVQKVQTEHDYAPQVGRQPERNPEPLVPVRYLTPEQRAEPIIVEPAPIYVSSAEQEAEQKPSAPRDSGVSIDMPVDNSVPSYIRSEVRRVGKECGSRCRSWW